MPQIPPPASGHELELIELGIDPDAAWRLTHPPTGKRSAAVGFCPPGSARDSRVSRPAERAGTAGPIVQ
jgi:hypothetical protein